VLHTQALTSGHVAASRLSGEDSYGATVAVATTGGEVIALLDARLAAAEFASLPLPSTAFLIPDRVTGGSRAGVAGVSTADGSLSRWSHCAMSPCV